MKIVIGGDIVATESNLQMFEQGDMVRIIGPELNACLQECDIRIFNMEAPLTDTVNPISKCGPCLRMPSAAVNGIKNLNPTVVTIANNHIMDQGISGLMDTVAALNAAGIPYVGVGKNIDEARKGYFIEKDGLVLGVYACAEHEFSIADKNSAGANPFEPLDSLDDIAEMKKQCDFLIVLYHGGKEHFRYPSPRVQKAFRKMADKGADVVIAQHSHCIGCRENYKDALLVYGQGNFIFDNEDNEYWNSGLLIRLDVNENGLASADYIPFCKKKGGRIAAPDEEEKSELLGQFQHRSEQITEEGFIERNYADFAERNLEHLLKVLHGNNVLFKDCDKLVGGEFIYKLYDKKAMLATLNYVECEAHRELIIAALKDKSVKRKRILKEKDNE